MKPPSLWIVAAGTGGHILPGIDVADKIKEILEKRSLSPRILFFGTKNRLEAKIVPKEGYPLCFLWVLPLKGKGLLSKILGVVSMGLSAFAVLWTMLLQGRPRAVFSVGGYVSVPVVSVALLFRVPVFILEPNIRAGASNRILSKWAKKVFSVPMSDSEEVMKCPVLNFGNPVRGSFVPISIRSEVQTISILGGSQGAKSLCEVGLEVFQELLRWNPKLNLILQAGTANLEFSQTLAEKLGVQKRCKVYGFVRDMPKLLSVTDIVVARAGAMTISELSMAGMPTIFVPYPHAADDHQRVNASLLEKKGAARMVEEGNGFQGALSATLRDIILSDHSFQKRIQMSEKFRKESTADAGLRIAEEILKDIHLI